MPITKLRPDYMFDEDRLEELKTVVPEAFADGKLNWDILKEVLGPYLEAEVDETEYFGLFWPGKREARRLASLPSDGTLEPQPGLGVNEDGTHHVFVEGENLEVLKILRKSYAGQVKMIYIDPPYNTGKNFVYMDDYSEPLETYLRRTGQADEEGLLTTNVQAGGRFHSNWLNMMYPRLLLARQMLSKDGLLLVSIDDHEVHHLRAVLDEVFGEENFLAQLVWDLGTGTAAGHFTRAHEYVVVYAKDKSELPNFAYKGADSIISDRAIKKVSRANPASRIDFPAGIDFEGEDAEFTGQFGDAEVVKVISDRMVFRDGKLAQPVTLEAGWAMRDQILSWLSGKETFDTKGQRVIRFFFDKKGRLQYEKERGFVNPPSVLRNIASTRKGTKAVRDLLGEKVIDFPKPVELIQYIVQLITQDQDIVLDFFAGTGTTAQAVLEQNLEDGGHRRFVLVQIPEETEKGEFTTISAAGRARIRRAIANLYDGEEVEKVQEADLGFKCYELAHSNFKDWQPYVGERVEEIQMIFDAFESPLREDWTWEDLRTEILLMEGFPLDSRVTQLENFDRNRVELVISDFHEHRLLVCLDDKIAPQTISELRLSDKDVFICLDGALNDETKVQLSDAGNIHVV